MRVLFVYPDHSPALHWAWRGSYHHGLASVASSVKQAGHTTSLVHICNPMARDEFVSRVVRASPDLIGFTSTTNFAPVTRQMIGWIRDDGIRAPILVGGMHATLAPDEVIAWDGVDYICVGEGERPTAELCLRLSAGLTADDIPNVWSKHPANGHTPGGAPGGAVDIVRNPLRPLIENLDELPFGDRTIFDYANLVNESRGIATVMASRGCPFTCTYCCNHALSSVYGRRHYVRFRGVDHVMAELEQIRKEHSFVKGFHFDDDILFLQREWFTEFTEKYRQRIGMPFSCNYRVGVADELSIPLLAEAGCQHLQIGIESGNDRIRKHILGRNITSEQIVKAVALAHAHGIRVEANSMVGIPEETTRTMLDTVKLNARVRPDRMLVSILYPFPKTEMYDFCAEHGYLTERNTTSFLLDSVLDLKTVSRAQILMFRRAFPLLVAVYQLCAAIRPAFGAFAAEKLIDYALSLQVTARLADAMYYRLLGLRRLISRPSVFLGKTAMTR